MILQIFSNVDMRLGHPGLMKICESEGVTLSKMEKGNYVIFVNSKRNMLKMFSTKEMFAFLKLEKGKIDMSVIKSLPSYFKGGVLDYDAALKKKVMKELGLTEATQ